MNCKPGDLAYVIRSETGLNLGRVVRVVRIHDSVTHDLDGVALHGRTLGRLRWVLEKPLRSWRGDVMEPLYTCADCSLRPIRDPGDDARDETLNWLPVPVKESA